MLWALALLATLGTLWTGRELLVPLICAVVLVVLLSPLLRRIDALLRLGKVATS